MGRGRARQMKEGHTLKSRWEGALKEGGRPQEGALHRLGKASQERDRQTQRHLVGRRGRPVSGAQKRTKLGSSVPSSLMSWQGRRSWRGGFGPVAVGLLGHRAPTSCAALPRLTGISSSNSVAKDADG